MKKINEQKLQAFALGAMGKRPLTRKEQEEQRKREEEEAAATAFKEYVETFQAAPNPLGKIWVKAGTYDAGSGREDNKDKGKLYKPNLKLPEEKFEKVQDDTKLSAKSKAEAAALKKKGQEKKKSNLELFKEELRQIQEEREERHKYKHMAKHVVTHEPVEHIVKEVRHRDQEGGSFDNGDPNTTNLYLGNLNPKISEQQLMELFGRYGPLASIKIMWPRSEEERSRGRNCGFVAYMSRKDAERALKCLNGRDVMNYEMRLGWGKSVPILSHPYYVPPTLMEYTMPPPPSGLPFNAQPLTNEISTLPKGHYKEYCDDPEKREEMEKILCQSVVKVVIPTDKPLLALIHRIIEFVIREGPMFEASIMTREMDNPMFNFLFENESPAHIYYRWKLFSLLQGDTPTEWRENEFRMFINGPIWKPPCANLYTRGMPEELIVDLDAPESIKGALSNAQRNRLEDLIRRLTPQRSRIGDAMIFCIEHAEAADEILECLTESLSNAETIVSKKIARLYLISDILHNCTVKVSNASFFRNAVEKNLIEIFENLHTYYMALESRIKAEGFKVRVLKVCRAWDEWAVYPKEFLSKLKNIFLGLPINEKKPITTTNTAAAPPPPPSTADIDGMPLSGDEKDDEDLDGIPLDGAALLKSALLRGISEAHTPLAKDSNFIKSQDSSKDMDYDDDIDGIPLEEDIDGVPFDQSENSSEMMGRLQKPAGAFIPSKWETIDPEEVEAQAITTSKWDTLDPVAPEPPKFYDSEGSSSGEDNLETIRGAVNDDKRNRLREIEMKVMQYQDELESGQRELRSGWTMSQQIEHYRRKLMKKNAKQGSTEFTSADKYGTEKRKELKRSPSPSMEYSSSISKKSKRSKRSPSPSLSYSHRSNSPTTSVNSGSRSKSSRRSRSPLQQLSSYSSKRSNRNSLSPSPPPTGSSSRSVKSLKRNRGKSSSESPKRYSSRNDRISPGISKSSKYDQYDSPLRRQSSPSNDRLRYNSPGRLSSRKSPEKSSKRDLSPPHYRKSSPNRHRSEKHKHKHKY